MKIQLRTTLQHIWAELSEKLSDYDPEIKYGAGDAKARQILMQSSRQIAGIEDAEKDLGKIKNPAIAKDLQSIKDTIASVRTQMADRLDKVLIDLERKKQ